MICKNVSEENKMFCWVFLLFAHTFESNGRLDVCTQNKVPTPFLGNASSFSYTLMTSVCTLSNRCLWRDLYTHTHIHTHSRTRHEKSSEELPPWSDLSRRDIVDLGAVKRKCIADARSRLNWSWKWIAGLRGQIEPYKYEWCSFPFPLLFMCCWRVGSDQREGVCTCSSV